MRVVKAENLPTPDEVLVGDGFVAVRNTEVIKHTFEEAREAFLHLTTDGSIFPEWVGNIGDAVKYTMYHHNQFKTAFSSFEAGLSGEDEKPTYEIVILSENEDGGTAGFTLYDRAWSFHEEGDSIDIVAAPKLGYEFVEWTGDVDDVEDTADANTTITVTQNAIIKATFKEIEPNG